MYSQKKTLTQDACRLVDEFLFLSSSCSSRIATIWFEGLKLMNDTWEKLKLRNTFRMTAALDVKPQVYFSHIFQNSTTTKDLINTTVTGCIHSKSWDWYRWKPCRNRSMEYRSYLRLCKQHDLEWHMSWPYPDSLLHRTVICRCNFATGTYIRLYNLRLRLSCHSQHEARTKHDSCKYRRKWSRSDRQWDTQFVATCLYCSLDNNEHGECHGSHPRLLRSRNSVHPFEYQ
jgi:hypothetical protein